MKKSHLVVVFLGIAFWGLLANPGKSTAGVNVNIGLALPFPQVIAAAPPFLMPIPGTAVHYAPGYQTDIFHYSGAWYRPYGRNWYRAGNHNGPWTYIAPASVPRVVITLPGIYHYSAPERHRVYYRDYDKHYKKHWRDRRHNHERRHDHDRWDNHDRWDGRNRRFND